MASQLQPPVLIHFRHSEHTDRNGTIDGHWFCNSPFDVEQNVLDQAITRLKLVKEQFPKFKTSLHVKLEQTELSNVN